MKEAYLVYLDEADHTDAKSFTVCGLTAIPINETSALAAKIRKLIDDTGAFKIGETLKFNTNSRPRNFSEERHRTLKKAVLELIPQHRVTFFAYAYFNQISGGNYNPERNRIFGFNTLLACSNAWLKQIECVAFAQIDRLDMQKKHKEHKDGFEYLREKFQKGIKYHDNANWKPLERYLAFGMSCEGSSDLQIVSDLLTGSLRYIVNGQDDNVRLQLQDVIEKLMIKGDDGRFSGSGFHLRPLSLDSKAYPVDKRIEYDRLRAFLNKKHAKGN